MNIDTNKLAASSYTAGLADLGPADGSVTFGAQTVPASTTISQSTTFTIPKSQGMAYIRCKYTGITYLGINNRWQIVPCNFTFLDTSSPQKVGSLIASFVRSGNKITVTISVRGGSGGVVIPAMTVPIHVRFYELPF
jgi:hypothetical protein